MKFFLILLFALPLSLARSGEGSSESESCIQKAMRRHGHYVETVLKVIEDGGSINGVLKPLSFLNSGNTGFVFKGVRLEDDKPVAIKFINKKYSDRARTEYEMYSYLNAINNTEVEKYGIPTVYYYGHWQGLLVTAFTALERTLVQHAKLDGFNRYDFLLFMKRFIKQSKYIHSHGVRHDNIDPANILTRGCESFLIDFDFGSKMSDDNRGTTYIYAPLRYHQGVDRVATDDWESFLYVLCAMGRFMLDWFEKDFKSGTKAEIKASLEMYAELKANRKRIFEVIDEKEQGVLKHIVPVIRAFAKEALSDKPIPDYDGIDKLVTDVLEKHFPNETCFSWIARQISDGTIDEKSLSKETIEESIERANTNIGGLVIPKEISEYKDFNYPEVNEEFFTIYYAIKRAIRKHGKHVNTVLTMITDGESIHDVLRPLGFLSCGDTGFVLRGEILGTETQVVIKFFNKNGRDEAKREYEMYSYLNAINNTEVEKYGISTVYYYGRWNGFIVAAYTKLETTFEHRVMHDKYSPSDLLLLIKQFIKQSKYIHSRGVRHDNVGLKTIATRGCESFLFDFEEACKMTEDYGGSQHQYSALRLHQSVNRVATDDWESFLYIICYLADIGFEWIKTDLMRETDYNLEAAIKLCGEMKANREAIFEVIDQSEQKVHRSIIRAFAKEALSDKEIPNYDGIYGLVTDALAQNYPDQTCFSWIKIPSSCGSSRNKIEESIKRANTDISDLVIPKRFSKYDSFEYPDVNEEYFQK